MIYVNPNKLFLYIYVFLFIFNPTNFSSFNLLYILSLVAIFFISIDFKCYSALFFNKRIFLYSVFLCYLILYLFLFYLSGREEVVGRVYNYILVLLSLLCSIFIVVIYSKTYSFGFEGFLKFIVNIGVIQLFFVVFSLLLPDFRDWVLSSSRIENLTSISNDYGGLRSYGLANGYTSTFPMFMGVCAITLLVICLKSGAIKVLKNSGLIILFVFSVILNARIGLFPIVMYVLLFPLFFILEVKKATAFIALLLILSALLTPIFILLDFEKYFVRLVWAYEEVGNLLSGESTGTFAVLETMVFFPSDFLEFLFGGGVDVFGEQLNTVNSSDIGLVRDIYLHGFLNVCLFFLVMIYFAKPLIGNIKENFGLTFVIVFFSSLMVFYLKGAIWSSSEICNFIVLASVSAIFFNKGESRVEKYSYN